MSPNVTKFSVYVACGLTWSSSGSIPICYVLLVFMDDVMFSCNEPYVHRACS